MPHLSDGTVLSASTSTQRGGAPRRTCPSLARGIVVRYQAADESPLRVPTVDLLLPRFGLLCQSVPVNDSGAAGNGTAWTPSPCTDFDLARWDSYSPEQLDGDRVLVGFVDDDPALPVVLGPLPSQAASWLPTAADSAVRVLRHQGTEVRLDRLGNLTVDTTDAPRDNGGRALDPGGQPAGRILLNVGASTTLEVQVAGSRRLLVQDGRVSLVADEVHLGEDGLLPGHGGLPGVPGVVTGQCTCAFTGAPHPIVSSVVKAEKGV